MPVGRKISSSWARAASSTCLMTYSRVGSPPPPFCGAVFGTAAWPGAAAAAPPAPGTIFCAERATSSSPSILACSRYQHDQSASREPGGRRTRSGARRALDQDGIPATLQLINPEDLPAAATYAQVIVATG